MPYQVKDGKEEWESILLDLISRIEEFKHQQKIYDKIIAAENIEMVEYAKFLKGINISLDYFRKLLSNYCKAKISGKIDFEDFIFLKRYIEAGRELLSSNFTGRIERERVETKPERNLNLVYPHVVEYPNPWCNFFHIISRASNWKAYIVKNFIKKSKRDLEPEEDWSKGKIREKSEREKRILVRHAYENASYLFHNSDIIKEAKEFQALLFELFGENGKFTSLYKNLEKQLFKKEMPLFSPALPLNLDKFNEKIKEPRNELERKIERMLKNKQDFEKVYLVIKNSLDVLEVIKNTKALIATDRGYILPNKHLNYTLREYSLQDLIGLEKEIKELENHFNSIASGVMGRKHFFIYGPPGTGKTHLIYSLVNERNDLRLVELVGFDLLKSLEILVDTVQKYRQFDKINFIIYFDNVGGIIREEELATKILEGPVHYPRNVEAVVISNADKVSEPVLQRFGGVLKFDRPNKSTLSNIIKHYITLYNLNIEATEELVNLCYNHGFTGRDIRNICREIKEKNIKEVDVVINLIKEGISKKPTGEVILGQGESSYIL